ncbi:MAG: type II toxin-antitoxin system RelE/ParE family toxin [Proteobacteria bacterium]|nr:type II toxin-antitoxin system RelE/ParE family toxin [Pseudomonadota bacterium]
MTRRLTFRPTAEADLADIWEHSAARWSVAQAERYLTGLDDALALLCAHPEIARLHDFHPPARLFPYRSHLVVFTENEATLEVIRVMHMRSNWRVLLME